MRTALEEHKESTKDRERKSQRFDDGGLSAEDLQREQEALFEKARLKFLAMSGAAKASTASESFECDIPN